ncbi:hypothetical protein DIE20_03760 [Burkholderia sp. Bp9131]|nr:hypothetical protein DIE20_03760 [Burkholderia sp. Bp9131]RQR81679.1 hypothetical protein DIE10_17185 [Burkholderia sp. Bp9011]RQS75796.1 hypothetical protein DID97_15785 [Burkholderia sp. Bp8977]
MPTLLSAKPSVVCATLRIRSTNAVNCCWFESFIALKTPVISSVTKRGNDTALSTARVVPAIRSMAVPEYAEPASCATASAVPGRAASSS